MPASRDAHLSNMIICVEIIPGVLSHHVSADEFLKCLMCPSDEATPTDSTFWFREFLAAFMRFYVGVEISDLVYCFSAPAHMPAKLIRVVPSCAVSH